jgi:LytS/YehU family sensor histidine kinase
MLSLTNLDEAKKYRVRQEETNIYNNLVEIALGQKKFDQALSYITEHEKLARELESAEFMKLSYSLYARTYEAKGDYARSLDAYKQYKAWSDTLFNEERSRAFLAQEVKVEVLEKNKQLAEQNLRLSFLQDMVTQENRIKWLAIMGSIMLLATLVLLFQKFKARKRTNEILAIKNEQISRQKLQIEEINYQLENRMLRAQINPHFIFNSLGSIQHFITGDHKTEALKYLTKFSNLLRKVLESSITGNALLHEEIDLVKMYLELEALRFSGDFDYQINVDASVDTYSIELPTMILQPLIENAVLHGLMPKEKDRRLTLSFAMANANLEIKLSDNGIGREASRNMQANKHKANPSRGISVTEQRLQTLKEKYGWHISMKYEDLNDNGMSAGTCVTLIIPILELK